MASSWWGEELGSVVGCEADLPGGVVDGAVMVGTKHHEISEISGAVIGPVPDVVGVAHDRWSCAAGECAVVVAGDERDPQGGGDEALGASDVEGLAGGAQADREDVGVAREAAYCGVGQAEPVLGHRCSPGGPGVAGGCGSSGLCVICVDCVMT